MWIVCFSYAMGTNHCPYFCFDFLEVPPAKYSDWNLKEGSHREREDYKSFYDTVVLQDCSEKEFKRVF